MAEKKEVLFTVLTQQRILSTPGMTEKKYTMAVTYTAPGLAPATLFLPEEGYTFEKAKKAILEDIEKRRKEKPLEVTR